MSRAYWDRHLLSIDVTIISPLDLFSERDAFHQSTHDAHPMAAESTAVNVGKYIQDNNKPRHAFTDSLVLASLITKPIFMKFCEHYFLCLIL